MNIHYNGAYCCVHMYWWSCAIPPASHTNGRHQDVMMVTNAVVPHMCYGSHQYNMAWPYKTL